MRMPAQLADEQALQFLSSRIDYERTYPVPYDQRDFRLDRMRDLLARLGNPQDALRIGMAGEIIPITANNINGLSWEEAVRLFNMTSEERIEVCRDGGDVRTYGRERIGR